MNVIPWFYFSWELHGTALEEGLSAFHGGGGCCEGEERGVGWVEERRVGKGIRRMSNERNEKKRG